MKFNSRLAAMFSSLNLCFFLWICVSVCGGHILSGCSEDSNDITEGPLFLTPYIENGDLKTARMLSKSGELPNAPYVKSFSGFFTVNKEFNSNIFFWFFPAVNKNVNAPVLLWMQGGPGISGLFGLFVEHGPYVIQANRTAKLRKYHWAKTFHLIYVDNPVGSGFSFTDDDRGYVTNEDEMAEDMFEFLQQFFTMFPEYQHNDFYIAGESYAGKYVPSLTHYIHKMGPIAKFKLTGMSIGNGMCDPETMLDYSGYLYNIGLIDEKQAAVMQEVSEVIKQDIRKGNYYDALVGLDKLIMHFNVFPYVSLYKNFTGFENYYNFLIPKTPEDFDYFIEYVKLPGFKKALHLGNVEYQDGKTAQGHLLMDIMKSVKPNVTVVMNNYRVLIYNGQLDVIIPYPLTLNFLKTVEWKYADEYKKAERHIWYLKNSNNIAGYVHNVCDFYEVLVRNAGHILPYDQPEFAFDLISRFLNKEPYS